MTNHEIELRYRMSVHCEVLSDLIHRVEVALKLTDDDRSPLGEHWLGLVHRMQALLDEDSTLTPGLDVDLNRLAAVEMQSFYGMLEFKKEVERLEDLQNARLVGLMILISTIDELPEQLCA